MFAVAASAPCLAQSTIAYVDPLKESTFTRAHIGDVVPHPDGGVVAVYRVLDAATPNSHALVLRHLSESGDRV